MFQVSHKLNNEFPCILESYDAALSYVNERLCKECRSDLGKGGTWIGSDDWEVFRTITDVLDTSCGADWSVEEITGKSTLSDEQFELVSSQEINIYRFHYYGGPDDGVMSTGFRPYFKIVSEQGHIYEVKDQNNYLEWIDDHTYNIQLHYVGQSDQKSQIKELLNKLRKDNE